ncbi:ATP-dependent Clp protease proteolytic subunit 4 [Dionaea muscipula]
MEMLSLTSPLSTHPLPSSLSSSLKSHKPFLKPSSLSKSTVHLSSSSSPSILCNSLQVHYTASEPSLLKTLNLEFDGGFDKYGQLGGTVRASPQTQQNALRGAESDVMGLLLRERIVFLGSGIDDFVADAVMSQLLLLDAQDPNKDIRLFINSPGGSLSAAMAIFDVVQHVRADVSTVAFGAAVSTAAILLGGGKKGKRLAMPNSRIMIHQPLGGVSGQVADVEVQAREVMNNKKNVIRIISEFSGRSIQQVEKDIDRDRYMSPVEGVEYGIIDGIIDRDSIIPLVPVPERVKPKFTTAELVKDPRKFLVPDIPDDEIY